MRFLALDVGEKRIGVARGDAETRIAVPVGVVETGGGEWQELARLAELYGTKRFIVGLPRNNQGQETAQSAYAREFARQLVGCIPGSKVKFQDETLTSVVAEERLKQSGRQYTKGDIDVEAATIILQDYLEGLGGTSDRFFGTASAQPVFTGAPRLSSAAASVCPEKTAEAPGDAAISSGELTNINSNTEVEMSKKQQRRGKAARAKQGGRKAKKKRSVGKVVAWTASAILVVGVLGVAGIAGLKALRDHVREARAAEYAAQEAAMQAKVFEFTILPGETVREVRENLVAAGFDEAEVDEALTAEYDFAMLRDRPEGATLEGYLYGETAEFYEEASAREVVEFFLGEMQKAIDSNRLEKKYAKQGLSLWEGIVLASVVQKEARAADMPTVAQVFLARLEAGMALGSDVTVSYALDAVDPSRESVADNGEALQVDSCYNTRLYKGLPCGPIANPGLPALLAVAEPSDTDYLYFLTGDDGLMYYSYTEDEHVRNAAEHCQELCQVSL